MRTAGILVLTGTAWLSVLAGLWWLGRSRRERDGLRVRLGLEFAGCTGGRTLKGILLSLADRCLPLVPRLVDAAGRQRLEALLERAGHPWNLEVDRVIALRAGAGLLGLAVAVISVAAGLTGPVALALLPSLGWLGPEWALRWRASARQRQMALDLPDFLDLLAVSLEAGCSVDQALEAICRWFPGPLAEEFRRYLQESALGVPRHQALAQLASRTDCPELRWLCGLLGQGMELGVPLAGALSLQARDLRATRLARVRETVGQLGPRLTLVTTFLITPGVLVFLLTLIGLHLWYNPETLGLGPLAGP